MNINPLEEQHTEASAGGMLTDIGDSAPEGSAPDSDVPVGLDLSSARAKRRISLTNIVVAIVLVVSAGSLYLMRKQGKGAGMTFQVSRIDYELEKAGKANSDEQRLLADLARTRDGPELHADPIQKNPFQLESDPDGRPPVIHDTDLDRRRRADRRDQEITARLAGLQLNGILGGSVPLARVGGETVRVGDQVAELFIVSAINPENRSVELTANGQTYVLSMSESAQPRPRGRR